MFTGTVVARRTIAVEYICKGIAMRRPDLLRYGLWCGVAITAAGNRRLYAMTTPWLPHFAVNTLSLLLPDLLRMAMPRARLPGESTCQGVRELFRSAMVEMICDNPRYVLYVAPLAAGYLLSAPWLNIYKGELAELRVTGFGLDALPHAATAYAMTAFVNDTLRVMADLSSEEQLGGLPRWLDRRRNLISGAVLALATLIWELGEYRIHRLELAQRGDAEAINMQWSLGDTFGDCLANAIGWLLAATFSKRCARHSATCSEACRQVHSSKGHVVGVVVQSRCFTSVSMQAPFLHRLRVAGAAATRRR
jgi:hypothetical protein